MLEDREINSCLTVRALMGLAIDLVGCACK